ncbi:MAG: bifunctional UDP-N-acetylglucosamine diphosphorylase/glucosamine-1-phosphate N-acetyltransferase GlmU [Gammaproteobacteria bacterium]|nr:bifunctional UDP-N-acetylglucosamine diphosphorylase/glucosamine-1-phosphate N-acetyltransferase GlmU [Gammaproteobacteria bacterium]
MTTRNATFSIIILAAGQGTRMKSGLPKVLHEIGAKPLLEHVVVKARKLQPHQIYVVYGHGGEKVKNRLSALPVQWIEQAQQLGTGHAVNQAIPLIPDDHIVMVLYGDVPLVSETTLRSLAAASVKALGAVTCELTEPYGYGRIVRDAQQRVVRVVEEKDATPEQRAIREINAGIIAAPAVLLRSWLAALDNKNANGEYYLTDVIAKAVAQGVEVKTVAAAGMQEILGVNTKAQLAELEREYQWLQAQQLMAQGVTLRDPRRLDVRGEISVGKDVVIDVNVVLEGRVELGDRTYIGPNNILREVVVANDVTIKPNCIIEEARLGAGCEIGPFARIRPATVLAEKVHIGNFVELKKSDVGPGSKINHLSYVGDTTVGSGVNVGAGTITCNYDGANKFRTIIGDNAFIGSDTQLIAPVEIGAGATIGAGSTITQNTPPNELTLSRVKQVTVKGWKRPVKKKPE